MSMTFDIPTARLNAWCHLAVERLLISEIGLRILVALIEFHKGVYFVFVVAIMQQIFADEKRLEPPNRKRE